MNHPTSWAHFGDAGGHHGLLRAQGIDEEALGAIRWHTDQPLGAPSLWPAYFAGYPISDHYVVQFTQPDEQASRPGMVKTTLTAVPQRELSDVSLAELRRAALGAEDAGVAGPGDHIDGLEGSLDLLARSQSVYWLGPTLFDALVDQLWDVLSLSDRAALVFGMLFAPRSISYPQNEATKHGVYLVLDQLRARFPADSVIDAANPPPRTELSRAILNEAVGIASDLGIGVPTLQQWPHVVEINRHYGDAGASNPDGLRACAHLATLLAPNPEQGQALKHQLGARIVESSADASFSHIRGMRTLMLADLGVQLKDVVEPWAAAVVADPDRIDDLSVALAEVESTPGDSLSATLRLALTERIAEGGQQIIGYFEAAIARDHAAAFSVLAHHSDSEQIDPVLAALSGIGNRQWVHNAARQAHLPLTHGRSVPTEDPIEAFRSHLSIPEHSSESCARLAARCTPRGLVEATIELGAQILVLFAAEVTLQDIDALLPARPAIPMWLEIWAGAIEGGADPWSWLSPNDALTPVLDAAIDGRSYATMLVAALSEADDMDISSYPRRAEVWDAIEEPARSNLLQRTAVSVILNGTATSDLEPALRKAVLNTDVMAEAAASDVSAAIDALEELATYANSDIAKAVAKAADLGTEADRFAELVVRRHWTSTARYVVQKAPKRTDLASIAERCRRVSHSPLLDMFEAALAFLPKSTPQRSRNHTAPGELDVLIVTAIKVERNAVRRHLSNRKSRRAKHATVDVGEFEGIERVLRVGVIEVGPGNIKAASLTTMVVSAAEPEVVLMVGVAGGVKDLDIGDVVASSKVYWVEAGKSETDHEAPRTDYGPVSSELIQAARAVAVDDTWQSRRQRDDGSASRPNAVVAPIVVGEQVVASRESAAAKRIMALYGDAVVVAMEDVGVTTAADLGGSKSLAIRSVSDLLDDKAAADASGSQEVAADNAAAFAFELLARLPFSGLEEAPTTDAAS